MLFVRFAIVPIFVITIENVCASDKTVFRTLNGESLDVRNMMKEMTVILEMLQEQIRHTKDLEKKVSRMEELEEKVSRMEELEQKVCRVQELENKIEEHGNIIQHLTDQVKRYAAMDLHTAVTDTDNIQQNTSALHRSNVKSKHEVGSARNIRREVPEHVAFTAYLDHPLGGLASGMVIKFSSTYLNDGNAYNIHTGIFTVPVDGTYLFTFSIMRYHANQLVAKLVVDNVEMIDAIADPPNDGREHQGTNAAILFLRQGQSVWIQADHMESDSIDSWPGEKYCSFAGVLLY